jgi:signal transduction histidine kinase
MIRFNAMSRTTRRNFARSTAGFWRQTDISVSGIGISPENLDTIFEEFKRIAPSGEAKGSGLGLAITKRLVDDLHGKIEVFSEFGKGSRFVITLPKA